MRGLPIPGLLPFSATSEGMTVRVGVSFLEDQSDVAHGKWFWSYHIRIENDRERPVQLLTRHWIITDGDGRAVRVTGDGVVGEQPTIMPGDAHDYVSGCPLGTPTGSMEGHYGMVDDGGASLIVAIPRFPLAARSSASGHTA